MRIEEGRTIGNVRKGEEKRKEDRGQLGVIGVEGGEKRCWKGKVARKGNNRKTEKTKKGEHYERRGKGRKRWDAKMWDEK